MNGKYVRENKKYNAISTASIILFYRYINIIFVITNPCCL